MTTKRRKPITAAELSEQLRADPEFVARQKERERTLAERAARYRAEQATLLSELRAAGLKIQAVSDLINTSKKYEQAIPILLRHLQKPYSDVTRETIARSLAVPEAREAWPILVSEYRKAPMGISEDGFRLSAKDGLACALSVTATDEVLEELIGLAKERTHGTSRLLLLSGLRKSKNPLAKQALMELASDPDLAKEIASWRQRKWPY